MAMYSGTIKSFVPQKGWGFIECSETHQIYGKDIFVMKRALPDGFATKGDRVSFDVTQGQSGPEATDVQIVSDGGTGGGGGAQAGKAIGSKAWAMTRPSSGNSSGRSSSGFLGFIKSYNPTKGWGFVTSDALHQLYGKDIFFMKTALRSQQISAGDHVRFSITTGAKGPEATDVQPAAMASPGFGAPSPGGRRRAIGAGPSATAGGHWAEPAMLALPARPVAQAAPVAASGGQLLFGAIKSYNPEKGWGHIDCGAARELFGKDVFLMRTALGEQSVQPGTLISFRVAMAAKGPHAADVTVLPDGSFSVGGSQGGYFDGVVKSFNAGKGWGFITSEDITHIFGKDIFLHKQELNGSQPEPGDSVQFTVEPGKTGQLEAKNVSLTAGEGELPVPSVAPGPAYRPASRRSFADQRTRPY